jgi:hypothetical protein
MRTRRDLNSGLLALCRDSRHIHSPAGATPLAGGGLRPLRCRLLLKTPHRASVYVWTIAATPHGLI